MIAQTYRLPRVGADWLLALIFHNIHSTGVVEEIEKKYDGIFSDDVAVQLATAAYYIQVLENRDKLQSQDDITVALQAPGPVHCKSAIFMQMM